MVPEGPERESRSRELQYAQPLLPNITCTTRKLTVVLLHKQGEGQPEHSRSAKV